MTVISKPTNKPYVSDRPFNNPYDFPAKIPVLSRLYHPSTVGVLTASLAAFGPSPVLPSALRTPWDSIAPWVDWGINNRVLGVIPRRVYATVVAFTFGILLFRCLDWARWRTLKFLLTYKGWLYAPRSAKTKLWGMVVRLFMGTGNHKTYKLQAILPKQPLPDLDDTLDRWLGASRQFATPEEFEATRDAVACFRKTDGPKLQAYLEQKSKKELSWLADYWVTAAYLSNRDPIAVNNNYHISAGFPLSNKRPEALARAASWICSYTRFAEMLDNQQIPPTTLLDAIPLCMNAFRYVFGTVRIPGEHMDSIIKYNDKHVIVIRNGHFFKLELYARNNSNRRLVKLTAEEIEVQLQHISDTAQTLADILPVAALTVQGRAIWAKQRERLQQRNKEALHAVESSMFIVCLDDKAPEDVHQFCRLVLTGNGTGCDRWYDKCFNAVAFPDAMLGLNVEHSVIDATVFAMICEYCSFQENYHDGKLIPDLSKPPRILEPPQHMEWDLTGLEEEIRVAAVQSHALADDLDLWLCDCKYGKGFMKKKKISPDGYLQMMFQLAYYRLFNEVPKTYEPSTTRIFLLGRTETIHPGSPYSVAWVKAMGDPTTTQQTREELFRKAVKHQNRFRLDATIGDGCDRHLLGLLCASRELGMDLPGIFMDKAWRDPFVLSTSQTPTRSWESGLPVDFNCATGGFGPVCKDGYGLCYLLYGDEKINIAITSWNSSGRPRSHEFGEAICKAMEDTKTMLS